MSTPRVGGHERELRLGRRGRGFTWADEPFRFEDEVSAAIGAAAALAVGELLWVGTS